MNYQVNNVSSYYTKYKYAVIRDCKEEVKSFYNGDTTKRYWFYGSYNDLSVANQACADCGNGIIVETENITPLSINTSGW